MKQQTSKKALTLKTLSKSNVWDIQENDIFRLWKGAEKDADLRDNQRHYTDIIRSAFTIEEITNENELVKKKYEKLGYKVGVVKIDENTKLQWAIKKKPIMRVTDLTYENIRHISAAKLLEVLDRNFGGGWDSLSQGIQDIIEFGFDISTTTLPKDRLHKPGGMYEKKAGDGFEVLEIEKGSWVEAIFAKEKPIMERPKMKTNLNNSENPDDEDEFLDEEMSLEDEDEINEENYSTTFEIDEDPEEALSLDDVDDDEE